MSIDVAVAPNRHSPPAVLVREPFHEAGRARNRTLANLGHRPPAKTDALRQV